MTGRPRHVTDHQTATLTNLKYRLHLVGYSCRRTCLDHRRCGAILFTQPNRRSGGFPISKGDGRPPSCPMACTSGDAPACPVYYMAHSPSQNQTKPVVLGMVSSLALLQPLVCSHCHPAAASCRPVASCLSLAYSLTVSAPQHCVTSSKQGQSRWYKRRRGVTAFARDVST